MRSLMVMLAGISLLGSFAASASGDEKESAEEKKRESIVRFLSGQELYERGVQLGDKEGATAFTKALAEFTKANSLYPTPELEYNVGRTLEHLHELGQAVVAYQAYLKGSPEIAANKKDRDEAAQRIDSILLEHPELTPPPPGPAAPPPAQVTPPAKADLTAPVHNDGVLAPEVAPPPQDEKRPFYKRAVFWVPVAVVVVAAVVVGVLLAVLPNNASPISGSDAMSFHF